MTLLPNKHVPTSRTLLGLGAMLLARLDTATTVNGLWDMVIEEPEIGSLQNFMLTLDYLYAIGAIDYEQGLLIKAKR